MYKIAITTGDIKGIGPEITKKALDFLNLPKSDVVIIGQKISDIYDTIVVDDSINGEF